MVSNSKNKTKKKNKAFPTRVQVAMFCVWVGSSPPCSLSLFTVRAVGRRYRARRRCSRRGLSLLAAVCSGSRVAGFRGRIVCWSLEGPQLCSESLEGS